MRVSVGVTTGSVSMVSGASVSAELVAEDMSVVTCGCFSPQAESRMQTKRSSGKNFFIEISFILKVADRCLRLF